MFNTIYNYCQRFVSWLGMQARVQVRIDLISSLRKLETQELYKLLGDCNNLIASDYQQEDSLLDSPVLRIEYSNLKDSVLYVLQERQS